MKKELNIAAILKNKPKGTKLWSPLYGDVFYKRIVANDGVRVLCKGLGGSLGTDEKSFWKNGKFTLGGEICLFPSKEMRDWEKFAWKKGDVLSCGVDNLCIFKKWENDEYTEFDAEFVTPDYSGAILKTKDWVNVTNENIVKQHISKVEEIKGGKLNLETLQIEHPKQEFKDGDILHSNLVGNEVFIVKIEEKGILHSYVYMDIYNKVLNIDKDETFSISGCIYNGNIRLATDSEKQQLFSALEKEGKRWNPDTKQIEDLPKKCEFKPMDWCLMKDSTKYWELCQFAYTRKVHGTTIYSAVGGLIYYKCIPYNEETKHLLGTTDEWKGGEG
nr:hypothetical protein [uncultured Prevotella sp.]